jgi:dTMP kinase
MVSAGFFVVIEGADGTGKSTLAAKLANHLGATLTAEPSYGPIGWWVRKNLSDLPAAALPYLFAADRAQHVAGTIAPALSAGEMVVCDRYIPSSVAYQGQDAIALNTSFPVPDLTILLTVSPDVARERIAARDALTPFEERHAADLGARYVAALNALGWRYVTIDASAGIEEVLRGAVQYVARAQREKALQGAPSPEAVSGAARVPATPSEALSAPMAAMRLLLTARERWKPDGVIVVTPPIAASHGEPWRATIVNYLGDYSANFSAPTEEALYQTLIGMAP